MDGALVSHEDSDKDWQNKSQNLECPLRSNAVHA
jgi:hypothetical protein